MKVNIGIESVINYQDIIDQLRGINTVVFVGGIAPSLEGEEMPVSIDGFKGGDRTHIELPAVQRNFLKALKAAGKKVVFVNCSGSAIAFQPETESCDAILQAWYPGMKGGQAVAEVLYGKYNPSGKLPVTFYRSSDQLGDFEDYSMKGRTYRYMKTDRPLYPFGFGLSYTTFDIGSAKLSEQVLDLNEMRAVNLDIPVTNTGSRDGAEVVQVYVRNPQDPDGPLMQLRAFQRIELKAGEKGNVHLHLDKKTFEWFNEATNTVVTKSGQYELLYGNSSAPEALKKISITVIN